MNISDKLRPLLRLCLDLFNSRSSSSLGLLYYAFVPKAPSTEPVFQRHRRLREVKMTKEDLEAQLENLEELLENQQKALRQTIREIRKTLSKIPSQSAGGWTPKQQVILEFGLTWLWNSLKHFFAFVLELVFTCKYFIAGICMFRVKFLEPISKIKFRVNYPPQHWNSSIRAAEAIFLKIGQVEYQSRVPSYSTLQILFIVKAIERWAWPNLTSLTKQKTTNNLLKQA